MLQFIRSKETIGAGETVATPLRSSRTKLAKRNWQLYILVLPALVYAALFQYWPMYGIMIGFKNYNPALGIWGSSWADPWYYYFKLFFDSAWFVTTLKNTLILAMYGFVVGSILPLLLALMINEVQNVVFKKTVQTVTYLPYFVSTVVLIGMVNLMFDNNGVINKLINMAGCPTYPFLTSDAGFVNLYVWSGVWQGTGYGAIVYFAALSNVSPELIEASVIDGANRFQRMIHVSLPAVIPTFIILLILGAGSIMNVSYEKVFLMQNYINLEASEVINTYVYKTGILHAQYSLSTAVGLFNNIINMILMIIVNKIAGVVGETSLW